MHVSRIFVCSWWSSRARGEVVSPMVEGGFVDYAVVAEAYRDLEAAGVTALR